MTTPRHVVDQLIFAHQGLVRSIARGIQRSLPPFIDFDDLISYGQLGLAQAARDFDPDRGVQFATFAYYRIRGAILDGANQMAWFRRTSVAGERYARLSNDALDVEMRDRSGDEAGETKNDVRWLQNVGGKLAMVYLLSQLCESEHEAPQFADPDTRLPIQKLLDDEAKQKLWELIESLPADDQQLLRMTYLEGLTLKEAGEKLGIGKAWASRRHARCLALLARGLRRLEVAE